MKRLFADIEPYHYNITRHRRSVGGLPRLKVERLLKCPDGTFDITHICTYQVGEGVVEDYIPLDIAENFDSIHKPVMGPGEIRLHTRNDFAEPDFPIITQSKMNWSPVPRFTAIEVVPESTLNCISDNITRVFNK